MALFHGSQSAASPAPAAASSEGEARLLPRQADPQTKTVRTATDPNTGSGRRSLRVRFLIGSEGPTRVRGAATHHQGAAAAQEPANTRKRSASQSPRRKARDSFRGLFDSSSDDEEEEGSVPEPKEISNDLDGHQAALSCCPDAIQHLAVSTGLRACGVNSDGLRAFGESTRSRSIGSHKFCDGGIHATSQGAGASHERSATGEHTPHDSGVLYSSLEELEEASYDYEPPTTAGGSRSPPTTANQAVALQQEEMRLFRDCLYASEIALGLGPADQAFVLTGTQGGPEAPGTEVYSLRHEIRDPQDRVDRRGAVAKCQDFARRFTASDLSCGAL
ncbi:unnamed protein product [Phytophthora fragariaefolia]|uniref:Unnamed protein product n=1 Tax=Phytophthora fragariaefolia TaxID=1490495 RepID=A0A9W6Y231_9STRA|nr:unnamed protein product [Phytophthora fragariaefolia]